MALVETRWAGHHATYYAEFVTSLLRRGIKVLALLPSPEAFQPKLTAICHNLGLVPEEWVTMEKLEVLTCSIFTEKLDNDPIVAGQRWMLARRALERAEDRSEWSADMVFFCFFDTFVRFFPFPRIADTLIGRPWSGLYFRNHHFGWKLSGPKGWATKLAKGDAVMQSDLCLGLCVLDERFNPEMNAVMGRPPVQFPDVTDETIPTERGEAAKELKRRAGERKIIGMIGGEKRKGLITMLKMAEAVKGKEPWFFTCGGITYRETFSAEEWAWLENYMTSNPENVWVELQHGQRINDGADFNSFFQTCDVIYGAREQFEGSSNALTKAALLHRPVLGTRGELSGKRVEDYAMGLTIEEGNVEQGIEALRCLVLGQDQSGQPLKPRYDEYAALHARVRLDDVFGELLDRAETKNRALHA